MDKEQKTLKSPLSAIWCKECKAKVAGEAQKSLAREILLKIDIIETHLDLFGIDELRLLKELLKQIIG